MTAAMIPFPALPRPAPSFGPDPLEHVRQHPEREAEDRARIMRFHSAAIAFDCLRFCQNCRRAVATCRFSTILPSTTATPCPRPARRRRRRSGAARGRFPPRSGRRRRWPRRSARDGSASCRQTPCRGPVSHSAPQTVVVLEGVVDAVDDDEPSALRGQQAQARARASSAVRSGVGPAAELLDQIVGAHHHAAQPGCAAMAAAFSMPRGVSIIAQMRSRSAARDLGQRRPAAQDHRPWAAAPRRRPSAATAAGIVAAPFGVQPVDPHDLHPRAITARSPVPRREFRARAAFHRATPHPRDRR